MLAGRGGAGIQSLDLEIGFTVREAIEGLPRGVKLDLSKDGRNGAGSVTRSLHSANPEESAIRVKTRHTVL